jgi:hypothetical protein
MPEEKVASQHVEDNSSGIGETDDHIATDRYIVNSDFLMVARLTQFCMLRFVHPTLGLDPAAESRLRLKIDLYIVPIASLMYLFCFIDRANIGMDTYL